MKFFASMSVLRNSALVRAGAGSFFVRIGYMGLELLTTFALARFLGASGFGIYSFAFAVTRMAALPAQAGLPTLAVREVAKYQARGEYSFLRGFIFWSNAAVLTFSILLMGIGVSVLYSHPMRDLSPLLLILALILVPFVALGNLRGGVLRGLHRVLLGQLPENIIRPAIFVSAICVSAALGWQLNASSAMGLHIFAAVASFAWGAWMLRRVVPAETWESGREFESKRWLSALLPLSVFGGMQILNAQLSVLVLGLYKPVEDVGVYRVASQVGLLAGFSQIVVNMAVAPVIARTFAMADRRQMGRLVRSCARIVFVGTFLIFALLFAVGDSLLFFAFGTPFQSGYGALLVIAAGQLVASFGGISMISLNMTGNEGLLTKSIGIATAINVGAHFLFVPQYGLMAAAIATALSTALGGILAGYYARKALGVNPFVAL